MRRWTILIITVVCVLAGLGVAFAASLTYRGISITPAVEQLNLDAGQSSASYKIRLDNNNSYPVNLQASSLDFKSLNDTGGLAFISTDASQLEHKYGLAKYISLPSGPIDLPANGGQFVDVTINNSTDLSPGGHYAAILFKIAAPSAPTSSNSLQANQVISSLVFIRKTGGAIYSLDVTKLTPHRNYAWLGWPSRLDALFYNAGNVQSAPIGLVTLNNQHSQLNINSSLVLPGSSRLVSADLSNIKPPFWPGIYKLNLNYHPDEGGAAKNITVSFIYIDWRFLVVLALFIGAILATLPRRIRKSVLLFSRKMGERIYGSIKWLLAMTAKTAWRMLVYVDTVLGRWLNQHGRKTKK